MAKTKEGKPMTDRHAGYLVVLKKDVRDDDAQQILDAIGMIKGVAAATPIISDANLMIATVRAKNELRGKMFDLLADD